MKKLSVVAVLGLMAVMFAACGQGTPEDTLATAFKALQSGDLGALRETLTGDALEAYGTRAGMAQLAARLSGLSLNIAALVQSGAADTANGSLAYYVANVDAQKQGVQALRLTARLTCDTEYRSHPVAVHGRDVPSVDLDVDTAHTLCWITSLN